MAIVEYVERVWQDTSDTPLGEREQRKLRITELLNALADMRPARRREDPANICRIEDELILLLDDELIRNRRQRRTLAS